MSNILARIPHGDKPRVTEKIKQIWLQPDQRSAENLAKLIIEEYERKYSEAWAAWRKGSKTSFSSINFPD